MLLLLMTIDEEECQTVNSNTQKDDNYHKISHTTPRPRANFKAKAKDLSHKAKAKAKD